MAQVARSRKAKDAAGLGSLAYALSEGDSSVLTHSASDKPVEVVGEAIRRPKEFWDWISRCSADERVAAVVLNARKAYGQGGWPSDRGFMLAAAYLAVSEGVPDVSRAVGEVRLPRWVALDKHTPQGRSALREAARRIKVSSRHATWVSFYCESAVCNDLADSVWWKREIDWRLERVGLDYAGAYDLWKRLRPAVSGLLAKESQELTRHSLDTSPETGDGCLLAAEGTSNWLQQSLLSN